MPGRLQDPLLGEGAHLEVEAVGVLPAQREHRLDAPEAHDRIDLHVTAHRRRAERGGAVEEPPGAGLDVLDGEGPLGLGGDADGFRERALLARRALEEIRLVQVDVRIDEARHDEAPLAVEAQPRGRPGEIAERADPPRADADVGGSARRGPAGTPRPRGRTAPPRPSTEDTRDSRPLPRPGRPRTALTDPAPPSSVPATRLRWTRSSRRSGPYRCSPSSRARSSLAS